MATYYTSSSAAGGGVGSIGDEWTLQEAADGVAGGGGDLVLIKADGTYNETATIDFDTNAGAAENPNIFRGANSDGTDDGTVATIDGSGISSAPLFNINLTSIYITFNGLRLTAATTYNVNIGTSNDNGGISFINCRVDNASSAGIYNGESNSNTTLLFKNSEIDNNGGDGIDSAGVQRGGFRIIDCLIHDNTSDGIEDTSGVISKSVYIKTLFYNNGGHGLNINNNIENPIVESCVFFNNTSNGIEINATIVSMIVISNCIFRSNGGYGIDTNSGSLLQFSYADYNCFSNNTSGHIDINSGTPPGDNNVLDNPDFTSEVDGSEDFTLQAGSPCIDVGLGYDG